MNKFKEGDKVVMAKKHPKQGKYYPAVGKTGIIVEILSETAKVKWKKGSTLGSGEWYINIDYLAPTKNVELKQIADYKGREKQTIKAMEELAELIQALAKQDLQNIVEEIADVRNMLAQIEYLYGIKSQDIEIAQQTKIERTLAEIFLDI